ncbi:MAG: caspase family protein [Myxococcota bacterium]|nr:caspase family protein [Myxococcota bacterium]
MRVEQWASESPAAKPELGTYRALIIGIDRYENDDVWPTLGAARRDAETLHGLLTETYGFEDATLLVDEAATYGAVEEALQHLGERAAPDDLVLVYFAGHGSYRGRDKERIVGGCWIMHDSRTQREGSCRDALPADTVINYLQRVRSRHLLLATDACFSGTFVTRSGAEAKPRTGDVEAHYLNRLRHGSKKVLASGDPDRQVQDQDASGHSPFARSMLAMLRETASGYVSASDLKHAVEQAYKALGPGYSPTLESLPQHASSGEFVFVRKELQADLRARADERQMSEVDRLRAQLKSERESKALMARELAQLKGLAQTRPEAEEERQALEQTLTASAEAEQRQTKEVAESDLSDVEASTEALGEGKDLEAAGRYDEAASAYGEHVAQAPETAESANVLYHSATLYRRSGAERDEERALRAFVDHPAVQTDALAGDRLVLALGRLSELPAARKDTVLQKRLRAQTIEAFRDHGLSPGSPAAAAAAKASFEAAEERTQVYMALRVALDAKLEATGAVFEQKKAMLVELQKMYEDLAVYESFEWVTAGVYRIGTLYEEFANTIYAVPAPEGLNEEEMDVYTLQLEDLGTQFEDAAIHRYETAVKVSRRLEASNVWTRRALEAINRYKPDDYPLAGDAKAPPTEAPAPSPSKRP